MQGMPCEQDYGFARYRKRPVTSFKIGDRTVGPGHPCLIVGEVSQTHDGSLGMAHSFIDAIANAGADAVKFQTHIAEAESTPSEPWRIKFSPQDAIRFDYWKRMGFTKEQWEGLANHARERGLIFLSSPFSIEAVDLLTRVGVEVWKVASGEVSNLQMLSRMARTGSPVIFSSGMSTLSELDRSVAFVKETGVPVAVLQCTTAYPCPPEKIGLNLLPFFRQRYQSPIGLSDHSSNIYTGLAGAAVGMDILEVHVTLSREMFGPDVPASVTTEELGQLVEGIRFIETIRSNPVDKDEIAKEMDSLRRTFTKSIVSRVDMDVGTVLSEDVLALKKPGMGIPAERLYELVGQRLSRRVTAKEFLQEDDLEDRADE